MSSRSEEHTSELQSHSFISYAVFCLKKKKPRPQVSTCRRRTGTSWWPGSGRAVGRGLVDAYSDDGHGGRLEHGRGHAHFVFLMIGRPPIFPLFPYPPLFR